uniref:Galectin n=1 Tax=Sphenodon punctatus TaxID=8508 RepID=A0A8D0L8I8_SPHPU
MCSPHGLQILSGCVCVACFCKGLVLTHVNVKAGERIRVKGKVAPDAKSFALNLGRAGSDLLLHFNPRFDCHGDTRIIVCNSLSGGEWGEELREAEFPFQQGEETKPCRTEVMVKLPGDQEIKFPNRLGLEAVQFLSVEGDFGVKSIKFD